MILPRLMFVCGLIACAAALGPALTAAHPVSDAAALPPVADRKVDFVADIKPLIESSCIQCHAKGKTKGGISLETRDALLQGGDNGPAATPGHSAGSLIVQLVASSEADMLMPKKGSRWTPEQIGLLRAWIDQGMDWPAEVSFAKPPPNNLSPRKVAVPGEDRNGPPLDRLLAAYFQANSIDPPAVVDDRTYARRVYLDTIGLLPSPSDLESFVADKSPDKRAKLVWKLLSDHSGYADNWLTFWNDLLRNDYKGTGYIDGGRKQITGWLYSALLLNKPYDKFVRELVAPGPDSEGFVKGIVWRGDVPPSMTPPMQAAQSISQVFFGINLKCASCHDSFVNDWTLADAYGLAAVFSDQPLEMVECDRPLGKAVDARFLYPQIGTIDPKLSRADRLKRFADLITDPANGRLSRNVVNRLWGRLLGRGLVDPLDDMDKPAWSADMLDWLAEDLVAHKYDLKHTIEVILNSRAYQLAVTDQPFEGDTAAFVFRGPWARRLPAEQFADAVSTLTGEWPRVPSSIEFDFSGNGTLARAREPAWIWTSEPVADGVRRTAEQFLAARSRAPSGPTANQAAANKKGATASKAAAAAARNKKANPAEPAATPGDVPDSAQSPASAADPGGDRGGPGADPAGPADPAKSPDDAANQDAIVAMAQLAVASPEALALLSAAPEKLGPASARLVRHKVAFRKTFALDAVPDQAYAVVAASQRVEVILNGKSVPPMVSDRRKDSRTAVLDIRKLLKKGDNTIVVAVDSHTDRPNMRAEDRQTLPAVFNYLNDRSGVAFYARLSWGDKQTEWTTDATWQVVRAPAAGWQTEKYDHAAWPAVTVFPTGAAPADDGVVIDDAGRKPVGAIGYELGPRMQGLIAMTYHIGKFRAPLVASDPMQIALDRPNREQVVSCRQNAATTIQALELTNGATLDQKLKRSATRMAEEAAPNPAEWVESLYLRAMCRKPTDAERRIALDLLGSAPTPQSVADLLWAVTMQPEFQYVH